MKHGFIIKNSGLGYVAQLLFDGQVRYTVRPEEAKFHTTINEASELARELLRRALNPKISHLKIVPITITIVIGEVVKEFESV